MTGWVIMWIECYGFMARPVLYTLFYIQLPLGGKKRKYETHLPSAPYILVPSSLMLAMSHFKYRRSLLQTSQPAMVKVP
jgi:hypothetical protein